MACIIVSLVAIALCAAVVYLGFRYLALKRAIKAANDELQSIQQDLSQNRVVHLEASDKELEDLLVSINQSLEEVRAEKIRYAKSQQEFQSQIGALSHDLRTPLTVILGYLRLLQTPGASAARARPDAAADRDEMLATIEHKARGMHRLISQFYEYSRISAADLELSPKRLDAGRLLREIFADHCSMLESARLSVTTTLPSHPVFVIADSTALERIFANLLQNAQRYAQSSFHLFIEESDKAARFIFENDTCDVTEANLPRLFERFYVAESSRTAGSTGLGLTIAQLLAQKMGGTLTAELIGPAPAGPSAPAVSAGPAPSAPGAPAGPSAPGAPALVRFTLELDKAGFHDEKDGRVS